MKCKNCGFEYPEGSRFCPNCGEAICVPATVGVNPAAEKVLSVLKDNLFLALCIMMTAACVLSVAADGLPLINILITVFLWLTYSRSTKGIADANHLRFISGCVYASYVVTNVSAIILVVCGVIISVLFAVFSNSSELLATITTQLSELSPEFTDFPTVILSAAGWIIGVVFTIASAIGLVINVLGIRKIHRFAKSVYQGIMTQNPIFANPKGTKNWLVFFGVCSVISAFISLSSGAAAALASGCSAGAIIISAILINKYFVQIEN